MVFFMATILGDVQYTQNGTVTNPWGNSMIFLLQPDTLSAAHETQQGNKSRMKKSESRKWSEDREKRISMDRQDTPGPLPEGDPPDSQFEQKNEH